MCEPLAAMADIKSFRDLLVWQKSIDASVRIYKLTRKFSRDDQSSLGHQCRKSAVSIPSNIAEGFSRHSKATYIQHLWMSHASAAELETQLEIAHRTGAMDKGDLDVLTEDLREIGRMINGLVNALHRTA